MGKKRVLAAALAVIMGLSFNGDATSIVYAQEENVDNTTIQPVDITEGMQQSIGNYVTSFYSKRDTSTEARASTYSNSQNLLRKIADMVW